MAWNLHLVGHADESTVQPLVADFIAALENAGQVLDSATLTTDDGQTDVAVTPSTPPAQTVAGEPVVDTGAPAATDVPTDTPPTPPTPAVNE